MDSHRLLLFDLGGVLLENKVFSRLKLLTPQPYDGDSLRSRWLSSPSVRRFELGLVSPDEFAELFIKEWGLSLEPDEFLKEFASWPTGFYPQAVEILKRLRWRYRVGCLSNSNAIHWERFLGFKDDFDVSLSSHLLGAIKPDKEAFLRALAICKAAPDEVYFFDDTEENVWSAASLGIRAFHVEGTQKLIKLLHQEKLL